MPAKHSGPRASDAMGALATPFARAKRGTSVAGPNKPSTRFWHQGYGMIQDGNGDWVVPFVHEGTARQIAAQAKKRTKIQMIVVPLPRIHCWGYRPRNAEESK